MSGTNLFQPMRVGRMALQHRVVLAPLTRYKSTKKEHIPIVRLMSEYYGQRANRSGSLLITEATVIAPQAGGFDNVPGIWSETQVAAWREVSVCINFRLPPPHASSILKLTPHVRQVVDGVHQRGSFIYLQIWALGRVADPAILRLEGYPYVAPSAIKLDSKAESPRPLSLEEIQEYIQLFGNAADNAVAAGFDGVEVQGSNGYLIDQFLQDVSNQRTDEYGGSIQNRSRFALEVIKEVARVVGEDRTAVRLSPWNTYQSKLLSVAKKTLSKITYINYVDMGMNDPIPQYTHFVNELKAAHPGLAYLHVVEPDLAHSHRRMKEDTESNDFIRKIWYPRSLITTGGYTRDSALARSKKHENELIAFGKNYISNVSVLNGNPSKYTSLIFVSSPTFQIALNSIKPLRH